MITARTGVLFIPHTPQVDFKIRSLELASSCKKAGYESYYWGTYTSPPTSFREWARIGVAEMIRVPEVFPVRGTKYIRTSRIHWPSWVRVKYDRYQLRKLVSALPVEVVVDASFNGPVPSDDLSAKYIYDFVDYPKGQSAGGLADGVIGAKMRRAEVVTSASKKLAMVASEIGAAQPVVVPNGTDVQEFRAVSERERLETRSAFGFGDGDVVVGNIGNHQKHSDVEFFCQLFRGNGSLPEHFKGVVVGPLADDMQGLVERYESSRVVFAGSRPPSEMPRLFRACDIGTVPFRLSPHTHHALPIKVTEFLAAGCPVVSVPLNELKRWKLSNVTLVERELEKWRRAIRDVSRGSSESRVDGLDRFDWMRITETAIREIRRRLKCD